MKLSSINTAYSLSVNKPKQFAVQNCISQNNALQNNALQNKTLQNNSFSDKKKKIARGITAAASIAFLGAALVFLCKPDKTSQLIEEAVGYIKKESDEIIERGNKLFGEVKELLGKRTNDTFDNAEIPDTILNPMLSTLDDKYGKRHLLYYFKPDDTAIVATLDDKLKINYITSKAKQSDFVEFFAFDNDTVSSLSRHYTKNGIPDNRSDYFIFEKGKLASFKKGFKKDVSDNMLYEDSYLFNKKGVCTYYTRTPMAPDGTLYNEQNYRRTIFGNYTDTAYDDIQENSDDYLDDLAMAFSDGFLDFLA